MSLTVLERCRIGITTLKRVVASLAESDQKNLTVVTLQVKDELERYSLWIGNIDALHPAQSPLSLEARLHEDNDVLSHIMGLLDDLNEVVGDLLEIVSVEREERSTTTLETGRNASGVYAHERQIEDQNEETALLDEIKACITRLFRASRLTKRAATIDPFAKALSRTQHRFNDKFDIARVGKTFPKLAAEGSVWLQRRLGSAITHRRQFLSYIRDKRKILDVTLSQPELHLGILSRPSTEASILDPHHTAAHIPTAEKDADSCGDATSHTTLTRSNEDPLIAAQIPKLSNLQKNQKNEFECPFCFQGQKFADEDAWRRHALADLRPYVCTFPECNASYFGDIDEWFQHEMQQHRVTYSCRLCMDESFGLAQQYIDHIQRQHPEILEETSEQDALDIGRIPLKQISARDCPCCSDWPDRLRKGASGSSSASSGVLVVLPVDFKLHLASHLEQLALFALPTQYPADDDVNSNAVDAHDETKTRELDVSRLTLDRMNQPLEDTETRTRKSSLSTLTSENIGLPLENTDLFVNPGPVPQDTASTPDSVGPSRKNQKISTNVSTVATENPLISQTPFGYTIGTYWFCCNCGAVQAIANVCICNHELCRNCDILI